MSKKNYVAAGDGYFVLDILYKDDLCTGIGVVKTPVVAWQIDSDGYVDAVTLEGLMPDANILAPNGTVICAGFCEYTDEQQYFEANKAERVRMQHDKRA